VKDYGEYCREIYGNEECVPGLKRKDQNRKEQGKMSGRKLQYSLDEIKTRTHAGMVVQRLAVEKKEENPNLSDSEALSAVVNDQDHARVVAIYLDQPVPLEG